jgi:carboxymethylenebutenolidase
MPSLDLAAVWEAHCRYEFDTRDVDATMVTMVSEPYVNNIPTMTGASDTITSSVFTNIISLA